MGIGKKQGICPEICDHWYEMCKDDKVEALPEEDRSEVTTWLDFGGEVKLREIKNIEAREYCEGMGF